MNRAPAWLKRLTTPLADKIVYASSAYVSVKSTLNDLSSSLVTFEGDPDGPADQRLREFVTKLRPTTSAELSLLRVGGESDGGYVMAEPITAVGALSVGIGSDVSWDQAIGLRGIPVAMFDHTVRKLPAGVPNGVFHRVGIGPLRTNHVRPLADLLAMACIPPMGDVLLKVDVEGAEWHALVEPEPVDLSRFSQIVVELHGIKSLRQESEGRALLTSLSHLTANHFVIHVHANNYGELVRFDDWWFPNDIEVSLLRKDLLPNAHPAKSLRVDLDAPCDPRVTDIDLSALTRL